MCLCSRSIKEKRPSPQIQCENLHGPSEEMVQNISPVLISLNEVYVVESTLVEGLQFLIY